MSTIAVTNLKHESATGNNIVLDSSGNAAFADGSASAPSITNDGDTNTGIYFPAADNIGFATNGVIRGRWTTDGLCFNTDTAAANALDDYEEGTWTPAFDGSGAITYTQQVGTYTKVGRQVTCVFFIQVNTSSRTNVGNITGLPFTAGNTNYAGASLSAYETGSYSGQCNVLGLVANTTTVIQLRRTSSATAAPDTSTTANLSAGTLIAGSVTYFV